MVVSPPLRPGPVWGNEALPGLECGIVMRCWSMEREPVGSLVRFADVLAPVRAV
jgi:hypothetical protein